MFRYGFNLNLRNSPSEILELGEKCLATKLFHAIEVTYYENMQDTDVTDYNNAIQEIVSHYNPQVLVHISAFNLAEENRILRNAILSEIENCFCYTKSLGGREVIIHSGFIKTGQHVPLQGDNGVHPSTKQVFERSWSLSVRMMKRACLMAKEYGIKIYTENLNGSQLTKDGEELIQYLNDVNSDNLKIVFDVGHCYHTGHNIEKDILDMGIELQHLHIHDNHGEKDEHLPLGEGTLNIPLFADSLAQVDYKGVYMFEFNKCTPEKLKSSRNILQQQLNNYVK